MVDDGLSKRRMKCRRVASSTFARHGGGKGLLTMTIRATNQRLQVRPVTSIIGAEIGGVDLREPLDAESVSEIAAALVQVEGPVLSQPGHLVRPADRVRAQLRRHHARAPDRTRSGREARDLRRRLARREGAVRARRSPSEIRTAAAHRNGLAHRHHLRRQPRARFDPARRGDPALRRRHPVDEPRRRLRRPLGARSAI